MRLRRPLVCVSLFLALAFVGDRMGAMLMDRAVMSTRFRYAELYQGALPAEIVILGNSRGLHMFHPPAIRECVGRESANVSFNALPAVLTPVIWTDYLSHHAPPQRLLFEVTCLNRADEEGALERFKVYLAHSQGMRESLAEHRPTEYHSSQVSHLYRYNSELTWRSLLLAGKSDQDYIMTDHASHESIDRILSFGVEEIIFSTENMLAAKQVLAVAKQHHVPVDLIVGPFHPRYRAELKDLSRWISWVEQELGLPVHDYSQAIKDQQCFADHLHLNPEGAKVLAEILRRDGVL